MRSNPRLIMRLNSLAALDPGLPRCDVCCHAIIIAIGIIRDSNFTDTADKKTVSTTSLLVFTGISKFSDDFQTIISRAVQIARIPVSQLQSKDSKILQQKTL